MPHPANPQLSALWLVDPAQAAAQVIAALQGAATLGEAATALGVGRRTLYRWLKTRQELAAVRKTAWLAKELETS